MSCSARAHTQKHKHTLYARTSQHLLCQIILEEYIHRSIETSELGRIPHTVAIVSCRCEPAKCTMSPPLPAWRFLRQFPQTQSKFRVVFAGPHFQAALASASEILLGRRKGEGRTALPLPIEVIHAPTAESLRTAVAKADVILPFMEAIPSDLVESAPRLRLIQQFGVGLERVDVEEASAHGVAVSNVPAAGSGNAEATAEHAIMLAMMLLRRVGSDLPRRLRDGELGGMPLPRALLGKEVAVVGYGGVGSTLCRYLVAMGARVSAVRRREWCTVRDAYVDPAIRREDCIEQALRTADVVILACSVTAETMNLIREETLAWLSRGALVVNVGRGPLVEHRAILDAVKSGQVGGFASDVGVAHPTKPSEPWDPSDELTLHPNTIFTPHIGGYCDLSFGEEGKITEAVVRSIDAVSVGRPPPIWVNKPQSDG